jgi:hypothetical protein
MSKSDMVLIYMRYVQPRPQRHSKQAKHASRNVVNAFNDTRAHSHVNDIEMHQTTVIDQKPIVQVKKPIKLRRTHLSQATASHETIPSTSSNIAYDCTQGQPVDEIKKLKLS